jgi:hypothetical protein
MKKLKIVIVASFPAPNQPQVWVPISRKQPNCRRMVALDQFWPLPSSDIAYALKSALPQSTAIQSGRIESAKRAQSVA